MTNAAFLIAAAAMWPRTAGLAIGRALCLALVAIGVGSFLFHTHARAWASLADTAPILVFILLYLYAANRHFLEWPAWLALLGTAAFVPYAAALSPVFAALPFLEVSAFYWPVPVLILVYAVLLRRRAPRTARGLALGAMILIGSLVFRSLDAPVCDRWPVGTHFLWHLLNGTMLGWMIEVYRRHMLEEARTAG